MLPCIFGIFGETVTSPTNIDACFEDGSTTLETTGFVTIAYFLDIGWNIWFLADPNNASFGTPEPIPPDQNPLDDPNFILYGVLILQWFVLIQII